MAGPSRPCSQARSGPEARASSPRGRRPEPRAVRQREITARPHHVHPPATSLRMATGAARAGAAPAGLGHCSRGNGITFPAEGRAAGAGFSSARRTQSVDELRRRAHFGPHAAPPFPFSATARRCTRRAARTRMPRRSRWRSRRRRSRSPSRPRPTGTTRHGDVLRPCGFWSCAGGRRIGIPTAACSSPAPGAARSSQSGWRSSPDTLNERSAVTRGRAVIRPSISTKNDPRWCPS